MRRPAALASRMLRAAVAVLASLCIVAIQARASEPVVLVHVHGLAFSPDGRRLMIPSHFGLAVYEQGRWRSAEGPRHDYMGFAATRDRLYSSGHPEPGSKLVNPFGLMRSRDGGKAWETLALQGETDFHLLAASWSTNVIYVWNPAPSSRMKATGLHHTADEGKTWQARAAKGAPGDPASLAVHPTTASRVAMATSAGIFVSEDGGERFRRVASGQGLAVHFDLDGDALWYATFDGRARLARRTGGDGRVTESPLPPLERDAVTYIAQNPVERNVIAIATARRHVFLSRDGGRRWVSIAEGGAKLN